MTNPRYANGQLRRKLRARLRAMGGECGICHGRLGPIHTSCGGRLEQPPTGTLLVQCPEGQQSGANRAEKARKTHQCAADPGRRVVGGEGPPSRDPGDPGPSAPIYTQEKLERGVRAWQP